MPCPHMCSKSTLPIQRIPAGPSSCPDPKPTHMDLPDPAARVRALEQRFPDVEKGLRRQLSSGDNLPSRSIGTGTLLGSLGWWRWRGRWTPCSSPRWGMSACWGCVGARRGQRLLCGAPVLDLRCTGRPPCIPSIKDHRLLALPCALQEVVLEETRRSGAVQPENPGHAGAAQSCDAAGRWPAGLIGIRGDRTRNRREDSTKVIITRYTIM